MEITTLLRYLKPKYLIRNRRGTCTVCRKTTIFLLTGTPETIRNHALCVRCGSVSLHRHMALWIVNAFREKGIRALGDFSAGFSKVHRVLKPGGTISYTISSKSWTIWGSTRGWNGPRTRNRFGMARSIAAHSWR